jgi:hypothetical protein
VAINLGRANSQQMMMIIVIIITTTITITITSISITILLLLTCVYMLMLLQGAEILEVAINVGRANSQQAAGGAAPYLSLPSTAYSFSLPHGRPLIQGHFKVRTNKQEFRGAFASQGIWLEALPTDKAKLSISSSTSCHLTPSLAPPPLVIRTRCGAWRSALWTTPRSTAICHLIPSIPQSIAPLRITSCHLTP